MGGVYLDGCLSMVSFQQLIDAFDNEQSRLSYMDVIWRLWRAAQDLRFGDVSDEVSNDNSMINNNFFLYIWANWI